MKPRSIYWNALIVDWLGTLLIVIFCFIGGNLQSFKADVAQRGYPVVGSSLAQTNIQPPIAELDFEIVGGRIYIPAEFNGHKTSALLDTGASASLMDLALAEEWKLSIQGELSAQGTGSETVKGKLLRDAKLTFGGIVEPIPFAIPLGSLAEAEGRRLEVIVGYHFFQTHIVEFDYAKRHLRIFDGAAEVKTEGMSIPLRFVKNKPHITAEMLLGKTLYKLEAMVDTGASATGLSAKFLKNNTLDVKTSAKTVIAGGVGGYIEGRFFRADFLKIGAVKFARPILLMKETVGGLSGEEATNDILIGADLLKRFRVTFDYSHQRLILEASDDVAQPFEADKTGLRIYAQGEDLRSFKVVGVMADSSAEKAGIKVDDVIDTIDGVLVSKFTLQELRELLKSPTALKWQFGIRRGEQQLKLMVLAKSVI
jgi:predicted aspartyl protease